MSLFTDKILLITGGTGSFGNAVLSRFCKRTSAKSAYFPATKKSRTICGTSIRKDTRSTPEK